MTVTLYALVMLFAALVASIGLILLFRRHEQESLSKIKLFGQEFQFSAPGLVVTLAGCALFILLPVLGVTNIDLIGPTAVVSRDGGVLSGQHHDFNTAQPVKVGATIKGTITAPKDRDFFKFQVPATLSGVPKIRIIVEKTTFNLEAAIYDNDEQRVTWGGDGSHRTDPVSFSFESTPGAYYYIAVASSEGDRGEYKLIVKQE